MPDAIKRRGSDTRYVEILELFSSDLGSSLRYTHESGVALLRPICVKFWPFVQEKKDLEIALREVQSEKRSFDTFFKPVGSITGEYGQIRVQ